VAKAKRHERRDSRAVVSYVDGTWTDRLRARCRAIETDREAGVLQLVLEMSRRRGRAGGTKPDPLEAFVAACQRIDSILLIKPPFRGKLRERLRRTESVELCLTLRVPGSRVVYPASAVFGPDGISLTLG
jgi:hypothetical protein